MVPLLWPEGCRAVFELSAPRSHTKPPQASPPRHRTARLCAPGGPGSYRTCGPARPDRRALHAKTLPPGCKRHEQRGLRSRNRPPLTRTSTRPSSVIDRNDPTAAPPPGRFVFRIWRPLRDHKHQLPPPGHSNFQGPSAFPTRTNPQFAQHWNLMCRRFGRRGDDASHRFKGARPLNKRRRCGRRTATGRASRELSPADLEPSRRVAHLKSHPTQPGCASAYQTKKYIDH